MVQAKLFKVSGLLIEKVSSGESLSSSYFLIIILRTILAIAGDTRFFHIGDLEIDDVQGSYHFYILGFLPLLIALCIQKLSFAMTKFAKAIDDRK